MSARLIIPIVIVFWCLKFSNVSASELGAFEVPAQTEVWWVSEDNTHNNHDLQIRRFRSEKSIDDVIKFYTTAWESKNGQPGHALSAINHWQLISKLDKKYQWVVQIRKSDSAHGSEGFLSRMSLSPTHNLLLNRDDFVPKLPGAEILSTTRSNTPTQAQTQIQLLSGRPQRNGEKYKRYLNKLGWKFQDEFFHEETLTQRYEKTKRVIDIALVVFRRASTLAFVNEISHEK